MSSLRRGITPVRVSFLAVFGVTAIVALGLAASGAARVRPHRQFTHGVRSAAALRFTRALRGAAARQQSQDRVLKASSGSPTPTHTPDDGNLADRFAQYGNERVAPGTTVSGQALANAQQQAQGLEQSGGLWQEVTNQPYNGNPSDYTDPFWSDAGSGFSIVGGRTTALTTTSDGSWYAGTADGGVWRSQDQGSTWTPISDGLPSLSIGAVAVNPTDGSVWAGTGEANTNQDSYAGTGVYRLTARPGSASATTRAATIHWSPAPSTSSSSTRRAMAMRPPTTVSSATRRLRDSGLRSSIPRAPIPPRPTTTTSPPCRWCLAAPGST